jgi:hypothetical protein
MDHLELGMGQRRQRDGGQIGPCTEGDQVFE